MAKKIDYAALYTLRTDGRYMGYWHDADGARHAIYDRDPAALYRKIAEREATGAPSATFGAVAEAWSAQRWEELSYKTVEAYKPVFRRVVERFGARGLGDIQTADVAAYLQELARQGYARRSVQMHRDMVGQIYKYAIAEGLTQSSPVDHVQMPRGLSSGSRGIASDAAVAAVKAGLAQPFGLFAYLCLYSGLRRGEALALKYEDVDRAARLIHVRRAVEFVGNNPHIKQPKTASGKRDVILLDVLADALPQKKRGYVFAGDDGKPITRDQYRKRWAAYCAAIGQELTAHQLRHAYATILYEAGVGDKDTQEQLGHSRIELTRDIYQHITKRQRSRTAARLNEYIAAEDGDADDIDETARQIAALLAGKDARAVLARLAAIMAETGD